MSFFYFTSCLFLDVATAKWIQNMLCFKGIRQRMFWSNSCLKSVITIWGLALLYDCILDPWYSRPVNMVLISLVIYFLIVIVSFRQRGLDIMVNLGCLKLEPNIYFLYWMVGTFPVYPWQRLFLPHNEVFITYKLIHMVVS